MASAGAERLPGAQEGSAEGPAQLVEAPGGRSQSSEMTVRPSSLQTLGGGALAGQSCPVMGNQCLVPAPEACGIRVEDKCPVGPVAEPELQEERLKLEEERLKPEVEAVERGSRTMASIVRSNHGPKRKPVNLPGPSHQAHPRAEAELPQGLLLQKEDLESSQSEPSPSAKQHKKAKKRKSLGPPVIPAVVSTVSTPSETLGLERKAQRLRPLYQYINYCNPELNQAGEENREAEAEVEPEWELTLVPEEAGVEQLPNLLPVADFDSPNKLSEEGEAGKKSGGFFSAGFKAVYLACPETWQKYKFLSIT
uniref:Uncharacterized protein n=1 Tax=Rousettus aegyptiacus TaxID=9407 RepID=A0A7J8CE58_ROUAE|nr:hypothetical protein HJG63_001712 [Rousettus aegyptiacus]